MIRVFDSFMLDVLVNLNTWEILYKIDGEILRFGPRIVSLIQSINMLHNAISNSYVCAFRLHEPSSFVDVTYDWKFSLSLSLSLSLSYVTATFLYQIIFSFYFSLLDFASLPLNNFVSVSNIVRVSK